MTNAAFGQQIKQENIDQLFLTGPGEDLVPKLFMQMAKVPGFIGLFGKYTVNSDQQRWADYQRFDWSIRQLPAINVFESQVEDKTSDNAWLNGNITMQALWPPNFRRSDSRRVEAAYKGVVENFFASQYVTSMLDELYWITRPEKVYGLNEFGKVLTWQPNVEGIIKDGEQIPVTLVEVKYRIDLRAWYRALEFMNRTKAEPFKDTLSDLTNIKGTYDGVQSVENVDDPDIQLPDDIIVSNP